MKRVTKILCNKWLILLALVVAVYCYAAVYEGMSATPVDELGEIMTAVTEDEAFEEAYRGKDLGMSLDQYKASLGNIQVLKSRFLQGPLSFLTSCLAFSVSVLLIHGAVRLQERCRRLPEKTRILETVDVTFPFLLTETLKYLFFAIFALKTQTLVENHIAIAAIVSALSCAVPYGLNYLRRRQTNRPVAGVLTMGAVAGAANLAFQLL